MKKLKQRRSLDFSLLPEIGSMDIFSRLDPVLEATLRRMGFFTELSERAEVALMFFFQTDSKDSSARNDARLRAGLNEVYSIEAAAIRDLKRAGIRAQSPQLRDSRNPLVHLLYILRHVGVHSTPIRSRTETVNVISDWGGIQHEQSYGAVILSSLLVEDLLRSREVQDYYSEDDLLRLVKWTEVAQQVFGISEVFRSGLNAYVREVVAAANHKTA